MRVSARRRARWLAASVLTLAFGLQSSAMGAEEPFAVQVIATKDRTVAAEIADLDGDGRSDLLQIVFAGAPPRETRAVRAYLQRPSGEIPGRPDFEAPLPGPAAAFDLADVRGGPGIDLLLLAPKGITIVSFEPAPAVLRATEAPTTEAPTTEAPTTEVAGDIAAPIAMTVHQSKIPHGTTVGASEDERGLDKLAIASFAFGDEPWLIVPAFGETWLLSAEGEVRARLDVGGRSNYIIAAPGPVLAESDVQLFYDPPRIFVGDVDGDGRADIVGSARHELRIFMRREDGTYPEVADRQIWLGLVTDEDHIRGSGAVRTGAEDIDGNGTLDLLITRSSGSILDASATSSIYLNRGGVWDLEKPDAQVSVDAALSADQLLDIDGDGRLELVRIAVPMSVLELIEMFFSRAMDSNLRVYGFEDDGGTLRFQKRPIVSRKLDVPLDFDTGRPNGFIATLDFDLNDDGYRDLISSSDGSEIEVHLGGEQRYGKRQGRQELATAGRVREGDLNGDGLSDLVLYNPRKPGNDVYLLVNRGTLPGTPARRPELRAQP